MVASLRGAAVDAGRLPAVARALRQLSSTCRDDRGPERGARGLCVPNLCTGGRRCSPGVTGDTALAGTGFDSAVGSCGASVLIGRATAGVATGAARSPP